MNTARKPRRRPIAEKDEWLSMTDVSRVLGVAYNTVGQMALRGELVARRFAGRNLISRESLDAYLAHVAQMADAVAS